MIRLIVKSLGPIHPILKMLNAGLTFDDLKSECSMSNMLLTVSWKSTIDAKNCYHGASELKKLKTYTDYIMLGIANFDTLE